MSFAINTASEAAQVHGAHRRDRHPSLNCIGAALVVHHRQPCRSVYHNVAHDCSPARRRLASSRPSSWGPHLDGAIPAPLSPRLERAHGGKAASSLRSAMSSSTILTPGGMHTWPRPRGRAGRPERTSTRAVRSSPLSCDAHDQVKLMTAEPILARLDAQGLPELGRYQQPPRRVELYLGRGPRSFMNVGLNVSRRLREVGARRDRHPSLGSCTPPPAMPKRLSQRRSRLLSRTAAPRLFETEFFQGRFIPPFSDELVDVRFL